MSHHQDYVYSERKLRPIYDCLDNGCYKKALQEIDKLLKKAKESQYIKVLKSLTLIRLNRQKDAVEILSEVCRDIPTLDSTLQTLSMCYRELQRNDMIATIYENALKKKPTNERIFTQLFMAYVRLQDYKKQQMTALNLYKAHPKNPYYFWAVMSIYMQAITSNNDDIASKITLPLAEKMCQKFYKEKKFGSETEIDLYLMILEKQKNYSLMIDLIDSSLSKKKIPDTLGFVLYRKVKLLKIENRLEEAFNGLVELIKINNDQYDYYIEAFKVATLLDSPKNESSNESDFIFTFKILDLVEEMCNSGISSINPDKNSEENSNNLNQRNLRGPFIAKIILNNLIQQSANLMDNQENKINNENFKKLQIFQNIDFNIDSLYDYFQRFGSKFVCVKDIIYLLHNIQLNSEQTEKLLLKTKLSTLNINNESNTNEINKSLCHYYLSHYNRNNFSNIEERYSEASIIFEFYKKIFKINDCSDGDQLNKVSSSKDQKPFDSSIYLFANIMFFNVDLYSGNDFPKTFIFDMIVLLEWALFNNKNDFYVKLLLVCLYNSIGAALSSHALYESLEIKLIQNDTLGYLFLYGFLNNCLYSQAQQFLNTCWKFYTFNFKEASDYIISCYKYGSFTKIEEIMSFNYKLRNSIQYHFSFVERFYLNLIMDCKNQTSFSNYTNDFIKHILNGNFDIKWENVCDNRDLQLLSSNNNQQHTYIMDNLKEKTFTDEVLWLRYRFTLLEVITVASYLSDNYIENQNNNNSNNDNGLSEENNLNYDNITYDLFVNLLQKLKEIIKISESKVLDNNFKYFLESPAPSRLNCYFQTKYFNFILLFIDYLQNILAFSLGKTNENDKNLKADDIKDVFNGLFTDAELLVDSKEEFSLLEIRKFLEKMSYLIETLSLCICLLGIADNSISLLSKSNKKSKKKKTDNLNIKDNEHLVVLNECLVVFKKSLEKYIENLLDLINKKFEPSNVVSGLGYKFEFELLNVNSFVDSSKSKLNASYSKSITEMTAVLQAKQKYLSSLNVD